MYPHVPRLNVPPTPPDFGFPIAVEKNPFFDGSSDGQLDSPNSLNPSSPALPSSVSADAPRLPRISSQPHSTTFSKGGRERILWLNFLTWGLNFGTRRRSGEGWGGDRRGGAEGSGQGDAGGESRVGGPRTFITTTASKTRPWSGSWGSPLRPFLSESGGEGSSGGNPTLSDSQNTYLKLHPLFARSHRRAPPRAPSRAPTPRAHARRETSAEPRSGRPPRRPSQFSPRRTSPALPFRYGSQTRFSGVVC